MSMPAIDMLGQRVGRLVVVALAGRTQRGYRWECLCDCGTRFEVAGSNLRAGRTRSCGCLKRETSSARLAADITGQRFGRLVALKRLNERKRTNRVWLVQCDCGKQAWSTVHDLRFGRNKSCGCLREKRW